MAFNCVLPIGRIVRVSKVLRCLRGNLLDAPEFAPHAYGRTADLLKLPDSPAGRPGLHANRSLCRRSAVQVLTDVLAIDVFGNVLGDVACGAALAPVDSLQVASMLPRAGLIW